MSEAQEQTPIEQILAMLSAAPIAEGEQTPQQMRDNMEQMTAAFPVRDDAEITPVKAGGVPAEWVRTPASRKDHVLLYLHGGGYVLGSPKTHRCLTSQLAHLLKASVLVIDYRMGPEDPFPAAIDDVLAAWSWMIDEQGFDPAHCTIAGDSAGGGLTAAFLIAARDKNIKLPACASLLSPWTDLTGESKTLETNAKTDPMVGKEGLTNIAAFYLGDASAKDPLASPLFAELKGLPPLLVQVTSAEALYDDSRIFADNAKKAGVDVELQTWPGLVHVFQLFHFMLPEGQEALANIAKFTQKHCG